MKRTSKLKKGIQKPQKPGLKKLESKSRYTREKPAAADEEIESDEETLDRATDNSKKIEEDAFFQQETPEEKRIKMAKRIIDSLGQKQSQTEDEFITKLKAGRPGLADENDEVSNQLRLKHAEKQGKLFRKVADDFNVDEYDVHFLKGHKKSITCMDLSSNGQTVYTGGKDCSIIKWDLNTGSKIVFAGDKHNRSTEGHFDEILALTLTPDNKYLISGGKDRIVRIWDIHNQKQIRHFTGHRDTISAIKCDTDNDQFYSASFDRSIKVWNFREMAYMDTHYGHTSEIIDMDSYSKDRMLTCGYDRQVLFWKINEESHLAYKSDQPTVDTVSTLNDYNFLTGGQDGSLALWIMNKKKPIYHFNIGSWVLSTASLRSSDLFCAGTANGKLHLLKLAESRRSFERMKELSLDAGGLINAVKISKKENAIVCSHSKDMRLGRWVVDSKAKSGISIIKPKSFD